MKFALSLVLAGSANAQVSTVGTPSMGMTKAHSSWTSPPTAMLPALNSTRVMEYRERMGHGEKLGGFAVPQSVSVNAKTDGVCKLFPFTTNQSRVPAPPHAGALF